MVLYTVIFRLLHALMLVIAMSLHRVQLEDYFKTNNSTKKEN